MRRKPSTLWVFVLITCACFFLDSSSHKAIASESRHSDMLFGPLGLNTVPSARMDPVGTIKAGVSSLDPYVHGYLGIQLAEPLYINIRQSAEASGLRADPDRLYPGLDVKLRLLREGPTHPEIAVGLQSAIGHKRMAGEYLTFSKRYNDFGFTVGLAWGRLGSAAHFKNPLGTLSSHFDKARGLDGEMPTEPADWFTGEDIGLFAGVEYFTPVEGLSIKLDYGADRYEAEKAAFGFDAPAPWSAGLNYSPAPWVNLGLAAQGTDKIMGRVSFSGQVGKWRDRSAQLEHTVPIRPYRTDLLLPKEMEISAQREGILLNHTQSDIYEAQTRLSLKDETSAPHQIGRAAVHMANHAGPAVERLNITPGIMGLQGPSVSLLRKDLEKVALHKGSADELWHHAEFNTRDKKPLVRLNRKREHLFDLRTYSYTLENQASLAEEDNGALYRSAFLFGKRTTDFFGILDVGSTLRVNLANNLERITQLRPRALTPVRSDVDLFAARTFAVENAYTSFTHSFTPETHLVLIGGYLEEMYAGFGGEVLYRPFGSRFALGAEGWYSYKRNPYSDLNLQIYGDPAKTLHLNGWYDLPYYDMTLRASAGQYLADDLGITLGLDKSFKNGAKLEGFVTISDNADYDLFGGTTHNYHGIRLSLPLGGFKYMPQNAHTTFSASPFGRDTGQKIKSPLPVYGLTEPFSYDHIARHWEEILP